MRGNAFSPWRARAFFQVGFAVTFLIICWFILTWFMWLSAAAYFEWEFCGKLLPLGRGFPPFELRFSLLTLVFGYFTNLEVRFSICFFMC